MKLLIITKRQYTNKDLLEDQYGRLWEIPFHLSKMGHQIKGVLLSYRKRKNNQYESKNIEWNSFNFAYGLFNYLIYLIKAIRQFKPDVILASSDCFHVIFGVILGRAFGVPCVVELYDNYESFGLAKLPGVIYLYRKSLQQASGIICVSQTLSNLISNQTKCKKILVLENAINPDDFFPYDSEKGREQLGLPLDAEIIGTAGALNKDRGIQVLFQAFCLLAEKNSKIHLALAGVMDGNTKIPQHPRIHYLGVLPHHLINVFYNSLDLGIICLQDTEFGRYAFPQKLYEILACRTLVAAPKVGNLKEFFKNHPNNLYRADCPIDLKEKIVKLLNSPEEININVPSWKSQSIQLINWLESIKRR